MKIKHYILAGFFSILVALPAQAQEDPTPQASPAAEGEAEASEPTPTPAPTPTIEEFECEVAAPGERCSVNVSELVEVEYGEDELMLYQGTVAYKQADTGAWETFGSGTFDQERRPHGCGWSLKFRERLVEEIGCFDEGRRHGEWKACRMFINQDEQDFVGNRVCPSTEYEFDKIVIPPPEPEPELEEADSAEEPTAEGAEAADGEAADGEEAAGEEASQDEPAAG